MPPEPNNPPIAVLAARVMELANTVVDMTVGDAIRTVAGGDITLRKAIGQELSARAVKAKALKKQLVQEERMEVEMAILRQKTRCIKRQWRRDLEIRQREYEESFVLTGHEDDI